MGEKGPGVEIDEALEIARSASVERETAPDSEDAAPETGAAATSEPTPDPTSEDPTSEDPSSEPGPAPRTAPRSDRTSAERAPVDAATLKSRKAFARRQWRRRWLAWRYIIVGTLIIALLLGGIWAVYFSTWLQVKGTVAHGDMKMTNAKEVVKYAGVPIGEPLATADLGAVQLRVLNGLPMVRSVNVSREWPDKIRVDVTERTPVAVVSIGGRLRALDETGTVFWDYKKAPRGLPMVNTVTGTNSSALREAAAVASALPADLAKRVDHVEVTTVDSISLEMNNDKRVVWGSSAQSDTKADVLVALMKAEPKVARYDVSVPGQPVTSKSTD
ncbi:cell division protein FtsQ [Nocardioides albertanoniae]|uniref:Cell division protein FtsQ n=1 Tax=Nocardioides albertanoniae TaxID=1175486 RepID=A0A543A9P0_9ACTN|nr:FtsQ-type POTRA domain-containing protein [Nocardioides albertanoniae]TQL69220.1 cell division protein FtsQ [Nocardioides albertanoniae]